MALNPPSDENMLLSTTRLVLEPVKSTHADEMAMVLSSEDLYKYVPQDPPDVEKLRKPYEFWESRISPEKDELWLNWVARLNDTRQLVGHFQAGYKGPEEISIAYTVGFNHQRRGYAAEALQAVLLFLKESLNAKSVKAWIDTRNNASIELVEKLVLEKVEIIKNADSFKGNSSDEFVYQIDIQ